MSLGIMATLLFSYLVLALCSVSVSGESVYLSIDCGSSISYDSYMDKKVMQWTGDDKYIKTGEVRSVKSLTPTSPQMEHKFMDDYVMDSMRVFTTGKKNCYHIDSIRSARVLVRASFYYGDYDKKFSPPSFDLYIDGNYWETVETSTSQYVFHEVIYYMRKNSISVCVVQTKQLQFPFISALEVRTLEPTMYVKMQNHPLFLRRRIPISSSIIRYPVDPYDRIWNGYEPYYDGVTIVYDAAGLGNQTEKGDRPPPSVLKNGITASTPNSSIQIFQLHNYETPAYVNAYVAEVTELGIFRETTAFSIFKDNHKELYTEPFLTMAESFTQVCLSYNLSVTGRSSFSLVRANYSRRPLVIMALEIFLMGDALADGTDDKDMEGLASLQKAFAVLQNWSGDPCVPLLYKWEWVACNHDPAPRVTALYLDSFGLSGEIPDFSSMDALQIIDLRNNKLKGTVPDFLGKLPDLKILILEVNQLSGYLPDSLSNKKGLDLVVGWNPGLCIRGKPCPSSCSRNKSNNIIIQILIGSIISSIIYNACLGLV